MVSNIVGNFPYLSLGGLKNGQQGTCSTETNCEPVNEIVKAASEPSSSLALQPIQSDLLTLNIRPAGGPDYNIHELPSIDGKIILLHLL